MTLSPTERRTLLEVARTCIRAATAGDKRPAPPMGQGELARKAGVFVSLHEKTDQSLRGCIGTFASNWPLPATVQEMAVAAALKDPRFPQVTEEEVPGLEIEISVLSEPRPITDIEEIQVGMHGLYIIKGMHRGVLLPQVATDQGWDRQTFLENTCLKAGLGADAWKESDTTVLVFSAEIFGEQDTPGGEPSGEELDAL